MNREAEDLTAALRDLPGVADAELASDTAEGVRVRLSAEADPTDVAAAVRDVLAHYGLKGRMAPPQARIEPAGPPPPPVEATILRGPGLLQTTLIPGMADEDADAEAAEAPDDDLEEHPAGAAAAPAPATAPEGIEQFIRAPEPVVRPEEPAEPAERPATPPGRGLLARVRVQEDRDGVAVTVDTDDGRTVTRRGRPSDAGVREAVVAAVGEMSGDQPPPVLLAVEEHELGDHNMVTVLLQRHDGSFHVGSALIGAEKAFALARAAWAALSQAR
ncbi:MAG: hypothetical protein KJO17_12435 [Acidimicrobiia bacterium]|nr:hypothetical protein [Acidimicrobiia bacterium]